MSETEKRGGTKWLTDRFAENQEMRRHLERLEKLPSNVHGVAYQVLRAAANVEYETLDTMMTRVRSFAAKIDLGVALSEEERAVLAAFTSGMTRSAALMNASVREAAHEKERIAAGEPIDAHTPAAPPKSA